MALWVRPAGARLRRAARGQELPVIDRPHKHWHCWPHLKPVLATRGLHLPTDAIPPANGPDPSWWGDMPAQTWFGGYLHDNLMDFTRFAQEYGLDRTTILRAGAPTTQSRSSTGGPTTGTDGPF